MSSDKFRDLLGDIILEINEIGKDETVWENTPFYRGYRQGMKAIMKVIEIEISAFGLSDSSALPKLLDVEKWSTRSLDIEPDQ